MNTLLKSTYGNAGLSPRQILSDPVLWLAFGFGSGLSRYMPGTLGTLVAIPSYLLLIWSNQPWLYSAVVIGLTLVGIWICQQASQKLAVHDFNGIVWDEYAGFLITLWGLPFSWQALVAGFVLFRLLDIVKPWPISYVDRRVHGGFGIMLDDVLAALLANLILRFWF